MKQAISRFASETEKREYVLSVEKNFEQALDFKVAEILDGHFPRILLLAGPTCAGKTSLPNAESTCRSFLLMISFWIESSLT